ncbi:MAG TPA: Hsp20/alpha crystallin family protein [Candidatus Margulisiibacteriota bacterium]|nr:Hsp20/alpha crystallin family protein [Candidatus Margulisiibacteriota bacterium]
MSGAQELAPREKKEVTGREEKTVPGRHYMPATDIFETEEALMVIMEIPGVHKNDVNVSLDNNVLSVEGRINLTKYEGMEPVYTEYGVGNYSRSFTVSDRIDRDRITAEVTGGVLTLTLPKMKEAQPRRIPIG